MLRVFWLSARERVFDGGLDDSGQADFSGQLDLGAGNLAIAIVAANDTRLLDQHKPATCWWVVGENIQWVFAGVKTVVAGRGAVFVLVLLAKFVLEIAALQVAVEPLVCDQRRSLWRWRLFFFLRSLLCHVGSFMWSQKSRS